MSTATLTTKGQLTVPKAVREYLNVSSGDKVEFLIGEDGNVTMVAKTVDVSDIFGMIKTKKSASVEQMKEAIKQKAARRHSKK